MQQAPGDGQAGRDLPRPMAMALHGCRQRRSGWRWRVLGCRTTCTWSIPHCQRPSRRECSRCTRAGKQVLPGLDQRKHPGAWCTCLGHRSLEGAAIRPSSTVPWSTAPGSWWAGFPGVVRWMQTGFHLPLRAGDDSGCVRADDLVCLARLSSSNKEKNKMGLLSLAIWTPIVFGVLLLAVGRDEHSRAVRWIALIGAVAACW
jgi:hypothetical protein